VVLPAIIIDKKDNVATALRPIERGEKLNLLKENENIDITLVQPIPMGHKFAITDISKGLPVIKYGETIGRATAMISVGQHVHVHNVEGLRGRGDKQ
jgi:altronate dehydratase small subunit